MVLELACDPVKPHLYFSYRIEIPKMKSFILAFTTLCFLPSMVQADDLSPFGLANLQPISKVEGSKIRGAGRVASQHRFRWIHCDRFGSRFGFDLELQCHPVQLNGG